MERHPYPVLRMKGALPIMLIGLTTTVNKEYDLGRVGIEYVDCVRKAGAIPVLIPPFEEQKIAEFLERIDGLILTGGADIDPFLYGDTDISPKIEKIFRDHDLFEIALVRKAHELDMTVLGICRGMQLMNVAFGGSLYQDILDNGLSTTSHTQAKPYNKDAHDVSIEPKSLLARLLADTHVAVNSIHHQAIRTLAPNLHINASSNDGVIEGIEDPSKSFFLGVQWHPEYLEDEQILFDEFVEYCSIYPDRSSGNSIGRC